MIIRIAFGDRIETYFSYRDTSVAATAASEFMCTLTPGRSPKISLRMI